MHHTCNMSLKYCTIWKVFKYMVNLISETRDITCQDFITRNDVLIRRYKSGRVWTDTLYDWFKIELYRLLSTYSFQDYDFIKYLISLLTEYYPDILGKTMKMYRWFMWNRQLHPNTTFVSVQANVVNFAMMHDHVVGGKYPILDYIYITKLDEQLTITFFFE